MIDKVAHTPLSGPTTYDFGQATPEEWPQGEYVPKAVYDALAAELALCKSQRLEIATAYEKGTHITECKARIAALEDLVKRELPFARTEGRKTWVSDAAHALYSTSETPADYTIDGDGVWMGGKWHPSGGPKVELDLTMLRACPVCYSHHRPDHPHFAEKIGAKHD